MMFKKIAKKIAPYFLVVAASLSILALVFLGHVKTYQIPSRHVMVSTDNANKSHTISQRRAIKKSRQSAVRILSWSVEAGSVSVSSGTYFKYNESYFVVTVHHGLLAKTCDGIQIEAADNLYSCSSVVVFDEHADYAILHVEEITPRTPLRFPRDFVQNRVSWLGSTAVLGKLIYTGYPNTIGPVTLEGNVMGMSLDEFIYFNSYAWSGSSGSGVFNLKGKFVGYIVALDVGRTEYGYDVLENVILVAPNYKIDWTPLIKWEAPND